ncbi:MAG: DsbA family protein [Patescibacteria group bacterium]|nr:DsbA family protein [Patescibacteria group bacterium]
MNTKRIAFWIGFLVVLALVIWGLVVAMNKSSAGANANLGAPAPITAADHMRGPAGAPVTLIEYGDFQCPACEAYYPIVEQVLSHSSTTVDFVFRHFPLPQHANAPLAAQAAEAAGMQGKFWEMFDVLFQNHADWTELADPHQIFDGYAQRLGLDMTRFKADIDSPAAKEAMQRDLAEGEQLGIDATPTFFVNGKAIENPQSYGQFQAIIDAAAH